MLAVESATPRASVALARGDEILAEGIRAGTRHHAETLLPLIDEVLAKAGVSLEEVHGFALSIGPGTFTSLRIGLATIKGLAFGADVPVAAVSTLATLAGEGPALDSRLPRVSVLDARRGEYYAAAFSLRDGDWAPEPSLLPEGVYGTEQLAAQLREPFVLVGEGAESLRLRLDTIQGVGACRASQDAAPGARAVARLGARMLRCGEGSAPEHLVPRYLRRAQAEEDRVGH